MKIKSNYYINAFVWSTIQKVLNAILGFISVPLLLGYYGKADYGILAIATACNGYMHLLDLGINTGAIKFFSQWKAEGKQNLIFKVARTNISFYIIISIINSICLILIALFGKSLFSITEDQFSQLQVCLFIIALFSVFSWVTTAFNQLLVADKQITFTMQVQCVQTILKTGLIFLVLVADLSLTYYFFCLTLILSSLIFPYALKCKATGLINSIKPANYWNDFKIVLSFSLSIFALSLFQMSATQSRPIILGIFAIDGAESVADFKIIEVIPTFIIMVGGTFSSIFLPKTSEMVVRGQQDEISTFSYKWTMVTTIIANILCFPFLLGSKDLICSYVGSEYSHLWLWLDIWIICVLCQIHSTPTNAMILSYGKTKLMVYISGIACIVSMLINGYLAPTLGVGSAVIGYSVYIIINLFSYYGYYYKKTLHISSLKILCSFLIPTIIGLLTCFLCLLLFNNINLLPFSSNERFSYLINFVIKTVAWILTYIPLLFIFRVVRIQGRHIKTIYNK